MSYEQKRNEILDSLEEGIKMHRNCPLGDGEMIRDDVSSIYDLTVKLANLTSDYLRNGDPSGE